MKRLLCTILAAVARHRPAAASLLRDRSEPLFSCVPVAYSEPSLTGNVAFYGGWYWDRTSGPCCVMIQYTKNWFQPWETIYEANPQQILDRREKVSLPPLLIMQGALDDNVLPSLQEKFAASYRAAGGECQLEVFEGCEHLWVDKPGPMTDRAHEMVKSFIARNLGALRRAA